MPEISCCSFQAKHLITRKRSPTGTLSPERKCRREGVGGVGVEDVGVGIGENGGRATAPL